eukprot:252065-Chlamydomonas_euryale.AAC.2
MALRQQAAGGASGTAAAAVQLEPPPAAAPPQRHGGGAAAMPVDAPVARADVHAAKLDISPLAMLDKWLGVA